MLNKTFSKDLAGNVIGDYRLADGLAKKIIEGNSAFDFDQTEWRRQPVFGDELWGKLARFGLCPESLAHMNVLEVCAGKGFLTYHLLNRAIPRKLTINDISEFELVKAREVVGMTCQNPGIKWVAGDVIEADLGGGFDLIIGNSFLHHFPDVPQLLSRFFELLNPGGVFVTLHEPSLMASVVEAGRVDLLPLGLTMPIFLNELARRFHKGGHSLTDLWVFDTKVLRKIALSIGFYKVEITPWGLIRPMVAHHLKLHPGDHKKILSEKEQAILRACIKVDAALNQWLGQRFFGSFALACRK